MLVLCCATAAFALVVPVTWAGVFRSSNAGLALKLAPYDGESKAALAMRTATTKPDQSTMNQARPLALAALKRSPLSVAGVRVLGLAADFEGRKADAGRLFGMASRISRRDFPTQLWLIEAAVQRNNIVDALRHYDIALRTTSSAPPVLYPVLLNASGDPAIAAPLSRILRQRTLWSKEFARQLVERGPDLDAVVALTDGLFDPRDNDDRSSIAALLARLVAAKRFDLAWTVYAQAKRRLGRSPAGVALVNDGGFASGADFPPFDWSLADTVDLSASRRPRPDRSTDSALWLSSSNGQTGEAARQLIRLSEGRYRLRFIAGSVPAAPLDRPTVQIRCANPDSALAEVRPRTPGEAASATTADFRVPAGCPWQWLSIRANNQNSGDSWIDEVQISRLAG